MKKTKRIVVMLIALTLFAVSCGSDDDVTETATGAEDNSNQPADPDNTDGNTDAGPDGDETMTETIERFWIGPQLVDCIGEARQKCMLVKRAADGEALYFYDQIDGFIHEIGTSYVLDVAVSDVENPPADAGSLKYRLVEIVESNTATVSDQIDGTAWTLLGFRDGDLFDQVTDDVQITITFAGEQVNGSAGCNNYMGTFSAAGDALTFGPLASTKMMCPPAVMQFEDRFLPLLSAVETWELTFDERLVLTGPTGMELVFAPAAA